MKKVLFTATVDSHIENFHIPYLKYFKQQGYEVHVATNGDDEIPYCDKKIKIPFERSPYKLNNLKAIKELKKVIMDEKYDIIHTHTPMGSVVTRLAAAKARKKYHTRVIYTAHGFHFYKGAPKKNWLIFYPVEKVLSKITDTLITINQEDYELAKNKFWCKDVQYVPGVGIDENKFNIKMTKKEKYDLRKSLGLKEDDFVMIYVARLDQNKNQGFLIEATRELIKTNPNIHLLLVGPDEYNGKYQEQAKDIMNNVHFTDLRKDIPKLLNVSNVAVSSSLREGLGLNVIESLYCALPVVVINNRGHRDIIKNNNGFIVNDIQEFEEKLLLLHNSNELYKKICKNTKESINQFLLDNVIGIMEKIYDINEIKHINNKYSIIVPAYNAEKNLEKCIKSVLNQSYDNFELIIVNDGSTDKTLDICSKYQKLDKRIKIVNQNNKGVLIARSNGVKTSNGDYIIFCDSDDELYKFTLEAINEIVDKYNPDIINYGWTNNKFDLILKSEGIFFGKDEIKDKIFPYLLEDKYGKYFSPSICDIAFKKELFLCSEYRDKKIEIGEDLACKKAMLYKANSLYVSNDLLYYYRKNKNSVTRSKKVYLWDGPELIGKHLESIIDIKTYDFKEQLSRVITHQLFLVVKSQFNKKDKYRIIKKDIINHLENDYYKSAIYDCKYSLFYIKGILAKFALKNKFIFIIYIYSLLS